MQPIFHCFNMIAIGSYFVLIMSMMGTIFAALVFSPEEENQFYKDILKEHNDYRTKHHSNHLELHEFSIYWANEYLNEWLNTSKVPNKMTVNTFSMQIKEDSKLDAELAKKIVKEWYKTGKNYNYNEEPKSKRNKTEPFTRIVWNFATRMGVKVKENNDMLYVVVKYYFIDVYDYKYKDNVIKP